MSPDGSGVRAPLLWLVLPAMAGIGATRILPAASGNAGWCAGAALVAAGLAAGLAGSRSRRGHLAWAVAVLAGASATGFAYAWHLAPAADPLEGAPPREVRADVRILLVFAAAPGARNLAGIARVETAPEVFPKLAGQRVYFSTLRRINAAPPERNSVCRIKGVLSAFPGRREVRGFDDYLVNLGVVARLERGFVEAQVEPPGWLQQAAGRAGRRFAGYLRRGFERRPELAAVPTAMLLGEKAALTPAQEAAFMRSGTYHVFSVSGLHVGVIAGAIQGLLLLARAPRALRVVLGLPALWFYVEVAGANPPAVRSFIMVAFLLARGIFGLPGNPFAALVAAAGVTLALDPRQLFNSGFQLSYLVVAAIVLMGLPLSARWQAAWRPFAALPEREWRWWQRLVVWVGRPLLGSLAITIAALVGSTPATIACFGLFTPGGLLANLVIVPLASGVIVAGFISILSGLVGIAGWCVLFNHTAAVLVVIMDRLVQTGTAVPLTHFPAEFRSAWMVPVALLLPLALMLAGAALRWRRTAGGFWLPAAGVAVLLLACVRLG